MITTWQVFKPNTIVLFREFFTPALADGFLLESK